MPEVNGVPCWAWDRVNESGWDDAALLCMTLRFLKNKGLLEEWVNQIDNGDENKEGEET